MKLAHTTFQNRNLATRAKFATAAALTAGIMLIPTNAKAILSDGIISATGNNCVLYGGTITTVSRTVQVDDKELSFFDWIKSKAFGVKKTVTFVESVCQPKPTKPKCFSSAKSECEVLGNVF